MKSVKIEGRVAGYVHQTKDGRWKSADSKKRKLGDHPTRFRAVRNVVKKAYNVDQQVTSIVKDELLRMDKKRRTQ